jgi:hypothetical protein
LWLLVAVEVVLEMLAVVVVGPGVIEQEQDFQSRLEQLIP